jgi:hypothetical protein
MIKLNLTAKGIHINEHSMVKKGEKLPVDLLRELGMCRIIMLNNGSNLHISDQLGLRFWTKDTLFTQAQLHFEVSDNDLFPGSPFTGLLLINDQAITIPLNINDLRMLDNSSISPDNDSLKFGVNIFNLNIDNLRIPFYLSKENNSTISSLFY